MKKLIKLQLVIIVAFVFSLTLGNLEALADVDCSTATVIMAGGAIPIPGSSNIRVYLRNNSGILVGSWPNNEARFFYMDQSIAKEGLATLLTAFATGKNVYVQIPGTTAANNSSITVVFIK